MTDVSIAIKILNAELKKQFGCPKQATSGSAGFDLRACIQEPLTLLPQAVHLLPTGISIYLKSQNLAALILPRSGLGHKNGLILGNGTGLIDADYQGEIFVSLWNRSNVPYTIEPMARIAQLIVIPICSVHWKYVTGQFTESNTRGDQGFGHTGII